MNDRIQDPTSPQNWPAVPRVKLDDLGAEPLLTETERETWRAIRHFSRNVMRPIGIALDKMPPDQVVASGSPYWDFYREFLKLGLRPEALLQLPPAERGRLSPILMEELGWGDAGLSAVIGVSFLPPLMALTFNRRFLVVRFPDTLRGCWAITEPAHGSDALDVSGQAFHAQGSYDSPGCTATIKGDKLVINGQKSAWVSNSPAAEVCVLCCAADSGDGVDRKRGCCIMVPLDAPGISRGKPLDKIGQRALPQGEIFFNNVELSTDYIIAGPDDYQRAVYFIHCEANAMMASIFTGVARSAYEQAFVYAHQRKQGGVPIIRHQSVASKLFHMHRKVEASRALAKRVAMYNTTSALPSLESAIAAKITGTQTAFEVANDAIQVFGGIGLSKDHSIEKIFRDARASLIEDGCNDLLAIKAGLGMIDPELLTGGEMHLLR